MYARCLAMFCLLFGSTLFGRSLPDADTGVVVYLKGASSISDTVLSEARIEAASLMQSLGVRVLWQEQAAGVGGYQGSLIVAEFRGNCSETARDDVFDMRGGRRPLAETSIVDGRILPFAYINCDALGRFLGSAVVSQPGKRRQFVYGRAIGRLLAHEIYHIVAQTRSHTVAGVAKEYFSLTDLLANGLAFNSNRPPVPGEFLN